MKALVLNKPMDFSYEMRPYPECPAGNVVVRVDAVCICGSDIHAIKGNQKMFSFPRVIGHEVAGTVHQVGEGVRNLAVGDRVCLMPCIPCGECRACQKGKTNTCSSLKLYGVHTDGGLQEYLSTPAQSWLKVPAQASAQEICMLEPLTIGAHAVAKLDLQPGDRVLVVGAGPIGISCAVNAQTYGAKVVLSDSSPSRQDYGAKQFGFQVLDPMAPDYLDRIQEVTEGNLFDAVVDTTAAKSAMENDWRYIAQGGKIVFVGICNGTLEIDGFQFHMREPALFVTRNSTQKDYERVLNFWQMGQLEPGKFVTHTVDFEDAADVLLHWTNPAAGVFKGVVTFSETTK